MIRLQIVVEGSTEERFARTMLTDALAPRGVFVTAMRVLRGQGARGGGSSWQPWRRHLRGLLRQDSSAELRVSTMLDLYALPRDTPGFDENLHGAARADAVLAGMRAEIDDWRFVPYVQVHEFEALLYADLSALHWTDPDIFGSAALEDLASSVQGLEPEAINEHYETAPSRRLGTAFPAYDKVEHGTRATAAIGLERLRAACPRFNDWLTGLERLGENTP